MKSSIGDRIVLLEWFLMFIFIQPASGTTCSSWQTGLLEFTKLIIALKALQSTPEVLLFVKELLEEAFAGFTRCIEVFSLASHILV